MTQLVKFPFGKITKLAPAYAANQAITIENMLTYIKLTALTGATDVDLIAAEGLEEGAEVIIDVIQGATGRNVTTTTGIISPDLTGVANDRDRIKLTYIGGEFIGGAWEKYYDAA